MHNSLRNSFFDETDAGSEELIAPGSPYRLHGIGILFLMAFTVITARLADVKIRLPPRYLAALEATTTEYEAIPARDGRILAEGRILAADIESYHLQVHYRWLQDPVDSVWLRQQTRNRLTRAEFQNSALRARAEAAILEQREALQQRLIDGLGWTVEDFRSSRRRIQRRVESVSAAVRQRHAIGDLRTAVDETSGGLLLRLAAKFRQALITPPRREDVPRIVVREEESWHTVAADVSFPLAAAVSEHPERFPGTRIVTSTVRTYPGQRMAAHVVGARTVASDAAPRTARSGSPSNRADGVASRSGRFGVELSCDQQLRGIPGVRRIVRNRRQQVVTSEITRQPVSGRDVELTIDPDLQQCCEQLLAESLAEVPLQRLHSSQRSRSGSDTDAAMADSDESEHPQDGGELSGGSRTVPPGGAVVVMEAASGRLLALASAPGFDLSLFTTTSHADWDSVNQDRRHPFISRFSSMALPPGSAFKILTAIAALEAGALDPETGFSCQGYLSNPEEHRCLIFRSLGRGHGSVTLTSALSQSCNVYFFDAAQRLGIAPLIDWSHRLGFGQLTGVDLPFEKTGTLPRLPTSLPAELTSATTGGIRVTSLPVHGTAGRTAMRRLEREALGLAIGQSRLTVTPLQMARLLAVVANGGWLVTPHVVSRDGISRRTDGGELPPEPVTRIHVAGLGDRSLQAVREGLLAAVEEPTGTAYRTGHLRHVRYAGKTGTAESRPGKPDHAWFAGFAPAEAPEFVIVVVLEHGGAGGQSAVPVAREIVRHLFPEPR